MRLRTITRLFSVSCLFSCLALGQAPADLASSSPSAGLVVSSVEPVVPLPEAPVVAQPIKPQNSVSNSFVQTAHLPEAPSHRFFDKTNLALHLGAITAETADLISTRQVLQTGGREGNPLARPLVQSGVGGQIVATYALGEGGALVTSYVLHRTGHHRLERIVPIAVMVVESFAAASNIRNQLRWRAK